MCRIFGVIKNDGQINYKNFLKVLQLQNHRGRDGSNFWLAKNKQIGIGYNRLSVIDLKQDIQPMFDFTKNFLISFDGKIYNFQELKKELKECGRKFLTNSDAEMILNAYAEWGSSFLSKINGVFSFVIVDFLKKELFIARDHLGVKPLVYYHGPNLFCVSSKLKTLSQIKNLDLTIDIESIDYYLWLQYIPAPHTIYKKVKKLEPAHYLRVSFGGDILEKRRYWLPVFKPDYAKKEDDWSYEFDEIFKRVIDRHIVLDVPYGVFLSGGINSTLIVKYLSKKNISNLKTFSIGFKDEQYNELQYSFEVSKTYNTKHYKKILDSDAFSIMPTLVSYYGEPFGNSSAILMYYVSQFASQHVKVVLSGNGGDELFGGYNAYKIWNQIAFNKDLRSRIITILGNVLSVIKPQRFVLKNSSLASWLSLISCFKHYERKNIWKKKYIFGVHSKYEIFKQYKKYFKQSAYVHRVQFFDLLNYLPFGVLGGLDVASMMNGLEVRIPFLDKDLVEFALTIPDEYNKVNGEWVGKRLLKDKLLVDFSGHFIDRAKQDFIVPVDKWFAFNGDLYSEPYLKLINSESVYFNEMFNKDWIYFFVLNNPAKTYLLLFLEEWLKQYEGNSNKIAI